MTTEPSSDSSGHYFDDDPAVASSPRTVSVTLPDVSLEFVTDRGVFSGDGLDAGTKLLLLEAPPIVATSPVILDLGCGWGPIACVTAVRYPDAEIWAVDVNERARNLTAGNAERLGLTNLKVAHPDAVEPTISFDWILSNPPVRIGKAALHKLLIRWLDRLTPPGRAVLVMQRHLGSDSLQRWLIEQGHPTERLRSRAGFRLLEVASSTGREKRDSK